MYSLRSVYHESSGRQRASTGHSVFIYSDAPYSGAYRFNTEVRGMSQAKVDKHKEEKRNVKQTMKKEKRRSRLAAVIAIVVVVALILGVLFSVINGIFA